MFFALRDEEKGRLRFEVKIVVTQIHMGMSRWESRPVTRSHYPCAGEVHIVGLVEESKNGGVKGSTTQTPPQQDQPP